VLNFLAGWSAESGTAPATRAINIYIIAPPRELPAQILSLRPETSVPGVLDLSDRRRARRGRRDIHLRLGIPLHDLPFNNNIALG
jgi:hypothetical protein